MSNQSHGRRTLYGRGHVNRLDHFLQSCWLLRVSFIVGTRRCGVRWTVIMIGYHRTGGFRSRGAPPPPCRQWHPAIPTGLIPRTGKAIMSEISEIDGCPILEVNSASIIGTWCDFRRYSIGRLASDEFTFVADHSFVWRRLMISDNGIIAFPGCIGRWSLDGSVLKLKIEKSEDPNSSPKHRIHFSIRMRLSDGLRELVLESTLYDDESHEGEHGLWLFPVEVHPGDADKNHEEYEAKRKKGVTIDGPFRELVPILTKSVPIAVGALGISEPIFCIRLLFFDGHAPADGYYCPVRCLTEPARQRVLREADPINVPDFLWHPTLGIAEQSPARDNGIYEADLALNPELKALYARIYELLGESEEETVLKLRAALRRVSLTLNVTKWPETVARTDDFVVFPADASNFFDGEYAQDMQASIPSSRLKTLKELGYISIEE